MVQLVKLVQLVRIDQLFGIFERIIPFYPLSFFLIRGMILPVIPVVLDYYYLSNVLDHMIS